jgi:hypothetical protein
MSKDPQKADNPKENIVLKTILDNSEPDKGVPAEKLASSQMFAIRNDSVNWVWVTDPDGEYGAKENPMEFPVIRDPETRKMTYQTRYHKKVEVPPHQIVYFTGKEIKDWHNCHSDSVESDRIRYGFVFDRTYTYRRKVYVQCCWVPDEKLRAGLIFEKKIHSQTRKPLAVLKKLKGAPNSPAYQIVGAKETDYRDLRRIYDRYFLKPLAIAEDEDLSRFTYDAIGPIAEEVAT